MHIGLIGGIGPAATDFYYRRLISTFASKKAALVKCDQGQKRLQQRVS
jgi:aspartate/glutamate racemase